MPTKPVEQSVRPDGLEPTPVALDSDVEGGEFGDDLADLLSETLTSSKDPVDPQPQKAKKNANGELIEAESPDEGPKDDLLGLDLADQSGEFDLDMEIDKTLAEIPMDYLDGGDEIADIGPTKGDGAAAAGDEPTEDDEDEAGGFDIDAAAEIDKLLSASFGLDSDLSDDNPDLAFPDFDKAPDDDDDDDDFAFLGGRWGGEEAPIDAEPEVEAPHPPQAKAKGKAKASKKAAASQKKDDARDKEIESLRAQVADLKRKLHDSELEQSTDVERLGILEAQVVQSARHSANIGREFEALRRRSERDREETQKFAGEKILKEFMGVLDNLERAMEHAGDEADSALGQGVSMTLDQFISALHRAGGERILPEPGEIFDPNEHEAVGQEHHDSIEAGHIVGRLQTGLSLNGRLLRAAMVSVSLGPADGQTKEPAAQTSDKKKGASKAKAAEASSSEDDEQGEDAAQSAASPEGDSTPKSSSGKGRKPTKAKKKKKKKKKK